MLTHVWSAALALLSALPARSICKSDTQEKRHTGFPVCRFCLLRKRAFPIWESPRTVDKPMLLTDEREQRGARGARPPRFQYIVAVICLKSCCFSDRLLFAQQTYWRRSHCVDTLRAFPIRECPCLFYAPTLSRYRNVTICAREQVCFGEKWVGSVPLVMPFSTAHMTA